MSVLIGSWEFEGPFYGTQRLRSAPGIVALLTKNQNELELVDLEESDCVRDFVRQKIDGKFGESFATAVYYCSELNTSLRQGLVDELMKEFAEDEVLAASA